MDYKIEFSKRYTSKLEKVYRYVAEEWSEKIAYKFLGKVQRRYELLIQYPLIGRASMKRKGIHSLQVTKHNRLYYRVNKGIIVILDLRDNRMNPKKNPY